MDIGKCPLKHKWDFRTGSPQRVFRAISDAIEDMGYTTEKSQSPELKPSPISDTATFTAEAIGRKSGSIASPGLILSGILSILISVILIVNWVASSLSRMQIGSIGTMVIGGILIIVGIVLIGAGSQKHAQVLIGRLEGEVYKAATRIGASAEVTDVVCDTRLIIAGGVAYGDVWVKDRKKQKILEADFREIQRRVEAVLPSFMIK